MVPETHADLDIEIGRAKAECPVADTLAKLEDKTRKQHYAAAAAAGCRSKQDIHTSRSAGNRQTGLETAAPHSKLGVP
jgi:hypothetical protein